MKAAWWLAAAALPLAAQPRLLVNAKLETHSAAAGLAAEFRERLAAQPQPAWVAYEAPLAAGARLGCELVSPNGWWAPGAVHLEPPERLVVMFRVESDAVARALALSPECQIDAGGLRFDWLTDVKPAESVALLATLLSGPDSVADGALRTIALHADPAALDFLISRARQPGNPHLRQQAVSLIGQSHDPRAVSFLEELLRK